MDVVVNYIIHEKGGQCSFYCRFPIESRFLKDFKTKKQVVFDTTMMEKGEEKMAKEKKLVEAITSMDEDFAQWYTDVVKKAELM